MSQSRAHSITAYLKLAHKVRFARQSLISRVCALPYLGLDDPRKLDIHRVAATGIDDVGHDLEPALPGLGPNMPGIDGYTWNMTEQEA
jgi:hypothetical protein